MPIIPTKKALFAAVLQHLAGVLADDQVVEIEHTMFVNGATFRQALIDLAQRIIRSAMQPDYLALMRIVIAESTRVPQLGTLFRSLIPMRGLAYLSSLLEHARERQLVEFEDAEVTARMFMGSLLSYILLDGLMLAGETPHQLDLAQITMLPRSLSLFIDARVCT